MRDPIYNFEGKEIQIGSLVENKNKRKGIVLSKVRDRLKFLIYWIDTGKRYRYFSHQVQNWKVL